MSTQSLPELTNEFPSRESWVEFRHSIGISGNGRGQCHTWTREAIEFLRKKGISGFNVGVRGATIPYGCIIHYWLEKETGKGRYIADGTAGQFDENYLNGFYGLFEEAPPPLSYFYKTRTIDTSNFD